MTAAILNDHNEVENIIVADKAFCDEHFPGRFILLAEGQWCSMGATWGGSTFVPAPEGS